LLYLLARLLIFTPTPDTPVLIVALTLGMMIGPMAVARISAERMKSGLAVIMALLVGAAVISLWPPRLPFIEIVAACLYGASLSASATLLWQALAERVRRSGDPDQWSGGTAFSLFAFVAKIGMVAGGWLTGRVLEGYVAGETASRSAILALTVGGAIGSVLLWQRLFRESGYAGTIRLQQEELAV
jgi:predicted MFS family arabinose efflux permease